MTRTFFITGGLGFIGSAVVRHLMTQTDARIVVYDAMTYAAMPDAVEGASASERYVFEQGDVRDADRLKSVLATHQPDTIMHLAAETHVDRSIDGPDAFIQSNIVGTYTLLQAARVYYDTLSDEARARFRFHHISTDEVFGSLTGEDAAFSETTRYDPRSPYSASKAASDHLVRAWGETFRLPIVLSNCSNNYGPWQYPEKLIPVMISLGLDGKPLPVYGSGENVRDWLHVDDHAQALVLIATRGRLGESYNVGGDCERTNLEVVHAVCDQLDKRAPKAKSHRDLISFVTDRPGHDFRYAIDHGKLTHELGWTPSHTFEQGLGETVDWYLDHQDWWRSILGKDGAAPRLGLGQKAAS